MRNTIAAIKRQLLWMELALREKMYFRTSETYLTTSGCTSSIQRCQESRLSTRWQSQGRAGLGQAGLPALSPRAGCGSDAQRILTAGLNSQERSPKATHMGLGKNTWVRVSERVSSGQGREMEGLGLTGQGNSRGKQRCWASRRGKRCQGMYLAGSRIPVVKCIFPASLRPSSALFPQLPASGRAPSSPQAGKTSSTMLAAHGAELQRRAGESRASHQPPPFANPPGHSPNYLAHPSLSPQGRHSVRGKSQGLPQLALQHQPCQLV